MPSRRKDQPVLRPNLGLFLDRPPLEVPKRGLVDGDNFRVKNGRLTSSNIGRTVYTEKTLNSSVLLLDNFFLRSGTQIIVFGSKTDLYRYVDTTDTLTYITPVYVVGTASASGTAVTGGGGTLWDTVGGGFVRKNALPGDEISFGSNAENDPNATWFVIGTVNTDTSITLTTSAGTVGSGTYTIRRLFNADVFNYWRSEIFPDALPDDEDKYYAWNPIDYVAEWNGTDTFMTLRDNIGFRFKEAIRYKNKFLTFDVILDSGESRPSSMKSSDIATPMDFINGDAAELIVHDGVDAIVGAFTLGDVVVAYGERSATIVQSVEGDLIYIFRTVVTGLGPVTGRAVADFGDFHRFRAADGEYEFDGVTIRELGAQLWRGILDSEDPVRRTLIHSHFDEENAELLWFVPRTTDPDLTDGEPQRAFVEHYAEDISDRDRTPYSTRLMPCTTTGFTEKVSSLTFADINEPWELQQFRWNSQVFRSNFPINLIGDELGNIFQLNGSGGLAQNTFGSDLVINGGFAADISSWDDLSSGSATISWDAGNFAMDLNGVDADNVAEAETTAGITVEPGKQYRLTWTQTVANVTVAVRTAKGTNVGAILSSFVAGTTGAQQIKFVVPADTPTLYLSFSKSAASELDAIVLREEVVDEIASFVRFPRRAPGGGVDKWLLKRIYPYTEAQPSASHNLTVTLWAATSAAGNLDKRAELSYDLSQTAGAIENEYFVTPYQVIRFYETQFGATGRNVPWTLTGYDVDGAEAGGR